MAAVGTTLYSKCRHTYYVTETDALKLNSLPSLNGVLMFLLRVHVSFFIKTLDQPK